MVLLVQSKFCLVAFRATCAIDGDISVAICLKALQFSSCAKEITNFSWHGPLKSVLVN